MCKNSPSNRFSTARFSVQPFTIAGFNCTECPEIMYCCVLWKGDDVKEKKEKRENRGENTSWLSDVSIG